MVRVRHIEKAPLLDNNGQDNNVGTIVWINDSNNGPSKTQKKRKKKGSNSKFIKGILVGAIFSGLFCACFNPSRFIAQERQGQPLRKRLPPPTPVDEDDSKYSQSNGVGGDFELNHRENGIQIEKGEKVDIPIQGLSEEATLDDGFVNLPRSELDDGFVNTARCGATREDANNHCHGSCQRDEDCFPGEWKCFFDLATNCPSIVDLPMSGVLSFAKDIGKVKNHWNSPLDKWNFCCGEGHYCSTCYGQSCCTGEPKCCQFGDDYDAECCSKAPGRCYWNECKPCPAGTYSPVGGHYGHLPGYTCPSCPPGTTSDEGATECHPE